MVVRVYTLAELAAYIDAELLGDAAQEVTGLATLQAASQGNLAFLANSKYLQFLENTQASAVIVDRDSADRCPVAALIVDDPYMAYAKISQLFSPSLVAAPGVHKSATISDSCTIGAEVSIGPNVVIEEDSVIGDHVTIGPGCIVGAGCSIGDYSRLNPNVTLYHGITLGQRNIIHSGAVIGADGFGFANNQGQWEKIHQLGGVVIGDDVEVGANTCIDRGALTDTQIGNGVKLDNHIQVGHNVVIGEHSAVAAGTAIAGSAEIGSYCTIAGAVGIAGHLTIADHVHVTGMSMVSSSLKTAGVYSSGTALTDNQTWRKNTARLRKLDEYTKRLLKLEKQFEQATEKNT
ncbi:MAG: UDP-3-O-(3-hydroxymyristoyl)glucosamine N-acyltransferase [Pseudomonadales bacterium]|nr:UDP-3-O-(3-hydroxymyristoyl)glucosamine N-acyltransferase [Pseudomonadales bacterium]